MLLAGVRACVGNRLGFLAATFTAIGTVLRRLLASRAAFATFSALHHVAARSAALPAASSRLGGILPSGGHYHHREHAQAKQALCY